MTTAQSEADRFTETVVTLRVLSERSIASDEIGAILENCDTGDCVLASTSLTEKTLTPKQMADALYAAGSEPGFFQLDDEGNHTDA